MASIEKQLLGTETAQAMRAKGVDSIICGLSANDVETRFIEAGADAFMLKPFPCKKDALTWELIQIINNSKRSHPDILLNVSECRIQPVDRKETASTTSGASTTE